jgi:tetratricopeptide (TPR) repeat protein
MRDKMMDKRVIFLPAAAQCKLLAAALLISLLAGCATSPQEKEASAPPEPEPEPAEATEKDRLAGLDSEVLFHVMAAERLVSLGEYRDALDQYLEAALRADDETLARQVTRLAAQLGEWEIALTGAERWLALAPGVLDATQIRLLAWLNTGSLDLAIDGLVELIEGHDDTQQGWRRATVLLSAAEDDDVAVEAMSRLIERTGRDALAPGVLHMQSVLFWQIGDPEQALELALEAAGESEERNYRVWAAQLAAEQGQLELALDLYRLARASEPDYVPLALSESEVLRQLERDDEAIALLREMPADSDVLYTLGVYLAYMERRDEGVEAWGKLAAHEPPEEPVQHYFMVARLAELLELDDEAQKWYRKVDAGPNRDRARLRRAVLQARSGKLEDARGLLQMVRRADDRLLVEQAWLVEAELLRDAGRAGEAVELLGRALRESPNSIRLLYARGLNAVHADDLELAEQDFRRIIQIDGDNAMALNALGYTLTDRTNRHQEAYRLIRRAMELEPDDPAILDSMGWVYFRLGRPEQALPYLERALEGEENPEIAAHVIEVLWTLDRQAEALELRDRAIAEWPDDGYLTDTLQRLELGE